MPTPEGKDHSDVPILSSLEDTQVNGHSDDRDEDCEARALRFAEYLAGHPDPEIEEIRYDRSRRVFVFLRRIGIEIIVTPQRLEHLAGKRAFITEANERLAKLERPKAA